MRDTSLAAAQSIGDAEQLRARVLVEIRQRGGATCDEVEVALQLRHQTASARVNELMMEGRVGDSGERRKTRSGRKAIVWKESAGMSAIDSFSGAYRFLSNFWPVEIEFEGAKYPSTEHAYQAAKTLDQLERKIVAEAPTASRAKKAGKVIHLRADWEQVKLSVMEIVLRAKFAREDLATKLIATGDRQLVEGNTWGDTFWGVCLGAGANHLGLLLMRLRDELRSPPAQKPLSPVLKWAGKKTWLLPRLRELRQGHEHRRWVEPFVGSMAVALGLRPKEALLRDANHHLVNLHRWLQRGLVTDRGLDLRSDEKTYYKQRDDFNALIAAECFDTKISAGLFYYLNRACYNGLCRFNSSGFFNTPWGKRIDVEFKTDFSEYEVALAGWVIGHGSFETTQLRPGDFVYLDPPYDGTFTDYSAGGFSWEQQVRLAEMFAAHDGPVVASNAATARVINLYRRLGFAVEFVAAPRSVAADASKRGAVLEILATKNLTPRR